MAYHLSFILLTFPVCEEDFLLEDFFLDLVNSLSVVGTIEELTLYVSTNKDK